MTQKRLLVIGAHPDDAEFNAGGLMVKWTRASHHLKLMSLTDGSAGHQTLSREKLKAIRKSEALASATLLGAQVEVWDQLDGTLTPSVDLRGELIRSIRHYQPDLIVTHRTADYHPDHRATAQLVQDACYLLQVPNVEPQVKPLNYIPPVLLASDGFSYPRPFKSDLVIDIETCVDTVVSLLDCHQSQVYDWLPSVIPQLGTPPETNRLAWLRQWYGKHTAHTARQYGYNLNYAESFEISEYGGPFTAEEFAFIHE